MNDDPDTFPEERADIRAAEIRVAQQREAIARLEEMGHATDTETLLLRTLEKELARLTESATGSRTGLKKGSAS
jgi:hypothetical protein